MEGAESTLIPGYRLDRYELLCPIASGGMASVWLARLRGKRGFEKLFAIKTIRTELISDPHFQEMFLDEARIASRIIHPNVAQILDLGEQDDILYIVMEYVDGDSLAKVNRVATKRGSPLPPGVSLRIIAETCSGLHAAHQLKDAHGESLGVVHRDVSPQNILVTTAGVAKVIDFGLVKAKNRSAAETQSGVVKGKIRYMAPEQICGQRVDHRADVWAAGMCLYELITGHMPFDAEDEFKVVKRLMSEDPLPPFDVALPPAIEKLLTRAIVKDPEGRFATCAAMRRAIESTIHELDLQAENEDVAEFLQENLPELSTRRSDTIAKALETAETRSAEVLSLEESVPGDIAFAATEVSARDRSTEQVLPLTRKRIVKSDVDGESADALETEEDRSVSSYRVRSTSATTLTEQLQQQRRRRSSIGFWLAALAVVAAGTFILWPREAPPPSTPTNAATTSSSSATPPASESPSLPSSEPSAAPTPTSTSMSTIELDPALNSPEPVTPPASSPTHVVGRPVPNRVTTPRPASRPAVVAPWDGGLSPGAMSAARIMLAPKPTETAPPSPSPPPPLPSGEQPPAN